MLSRADSLHLCCLLILAGCYSTSLLQEPKPLPVGGVRVAIGGEVGAPSSQPTIGVRVGVAPRTELRAKLNLGGAELGVNVLALDSYWVDLMVMPQYFFFDLDEVFDEEYTGARLQGFGLPTIASLSLDEQDQFQLFLGPDVRIGRNRNNQSGAPWSAFAVHLGAAIADPTQHFTFIPECTWTVGTAHDKVRERDWNADFLARGSMGFQCSLGLSVGSAHTPRQRR